MNDETDTGSMLEQAVGDDPYLWLEEVAGERALEWVRARNAEALDELAGERFGELKAEFLEVLDADDRIPYPHRRGEFLAGRCPPSGAVASHDVGLLSDAEPGVGGAGRRRRPRRPGG